MIPKRQTQARKHQPDYKLALIAFVLCLIGLVLIFALSPTLVKIQGGGLSSHFYTGRQFFAICLGALAFFAASRVNIKTWFKLNKIVLGMGIVTSALIAIPGLPFGITANGATRWFSLGVLSFQPAEVLKFGLLFYLAVFIARRASSGQLEDKEATLYPLAAIFGLVALVVGVVQKDFGSTTVIVFMGVMMLFFAGIRFGLLLKIAGFMLIPVTLLILAAPPPSRASCEFR